MVKTGQIWIGNFTTEDSSGSLATPSVGPIGTLYVAGVATVDVVTISGTNPYKFSVTLPALTAGQSVAMYITATISTIAKGAFVAQDIGDTFITSDIESALTSIKGLGWTTENLKAIYDQVLLRLLTSGYTAPPSAGTISTQVDSVLSASHGAGSWESTSGSGTITYPYLVKQADSTPIPDAFVEVSNNITKTAGSVVASGYTDNLGYVTFYLDPGTYYFFVSKAGWTFNNPDTEVVS